MRAATLLVVQGYEPGARFEIGDQPVHIGRGPQNEIRLLDTEVSRSHASVQRVRDELVVTDRNSSNGTFVNGKLVRSQSLRSGDQIQIGRTILLYAESSSASDPRELAQHVRLLHQHDPADHSSIVSQIAPETIRESMSPGTVDAAQQETNLQVLYRLSEEAVQPSLPLDQLLQRILDLALKAVGADRGCVLVVDPQDGEIHPHAVSGAVANNPSGRMPISRSIVDYVLKMGQGVHTSDARHDRRFDTAESIVQAGICEAMCVPLPGRNELLGVIYVDTTTPSDRAHLGGQPSRFQEGQLRLLLAIGRQAALAIENNRYQQAFVKAERLAAMGQTIAMLSHHIKNILQGVRGGSYLIDMGLKDHNEDLVRKGWGIVEKNQNKIYHMVMDMLTFSKERQPALQRASVNETVQDVFELMQSRAEECKVELRYEPHQEIPDCTFDAEGIHRAVLNIVTNAIDAVEGADHAAVLIQTGHSPESETVWVAVTDNGPGIPEDQLARIFNLFESTKGARGTGLGLAVSQKIMREHGGEITVESQLGEGSRFTLTWPRHDDDHAIGQTMA